MSNNKQTRLQPMAIRVTPKQFAGLQALKDEDGISVQDHIRRALDNYLRRTNPPIPQVLAQSPASNPAAELPGRISTGADRAGRQPPPAFGTPEPVNDAVPPRVQPKRQQVVYR